MSSSPVPLSSSPPPAASAPPAQPAVRNEREESNAVKTAKIIAAIAVALIALAAIIAICFFCPPFAAAMISVAVGIAAIAIAVALLASRIHYIDGHRTVYFGDRVLYRSRVVYYEWPRIEYNRQIYVPPRYSAPARELDVHVHPGRNNFIRRPVYGPYDSTFRRPAMPRTPVTRGTSSTVHLGEARTGSAQLRPYEPGPLSSHPRSSHMTSAPSRLSGISRSGAPFREPSRPSDTVHVGESQMRGPSRQSAFTRVGGSGRGNTPGARAPFNQR